MSKGAGRRTHDAQWSAWQQQPRAQKLTRRTRQIAQADDQFAQALRLRTEPARIDALVAGRGQFTSATACPRCGNAERRVSDRACWHCWQRHRPAAQWATVRAGTGYTGGKRSRDGHLAHLAWQREQAAQGVRTYQRGPWTVHQHPDQRVELWNSVRASHCPDLQREFNNNAAAWFALAQADADLTALLQDDLGW
ncbi:hypothetical protein ACIPRI_23160 [Variovorax sp. LARHSF232]